LPRQSRRCLDKLDYAGRSHNQRKNQYVSDVTLGSGAEPHDFYNHADAVWK